MTWQRRHTDALKGHGVGAADARVLVAMMEQGRAPHGVDEELVPFVEMRVRGARAVLETVAIAQATGPRGRFAAAWRLLYEGGCPLDHVWATLWHSFKDPTADPQDTVWLPKHVGLRNARRYVAIGFPRSGAPHVYGPGLGCETLLANARAGRRELDRAGAPFVFVVQTLNRARSALTPTARALLDRRAHIRPEDVVRRPAGDKLPLLASFEPGWDDLVRADDLAEDPVGPWFDALDAMLEGGELVADVVRDRYRLASEPAAVRQPIERRAPPAAGRAHPARVRRLVENWYRRARRRTDYFGGLATLRSLDAQDPLRWLGSVAAMATFVRYDFENGRAVILPPPRKKTRRS